MIEVNYMASCDKCDEDSLSPTLVNSQDELGETSLAGFWNHLRRGGWLKIMNKMYCPSCVAKHKAQRQVRIDLKAREREAERQA